jgi:hypothetical protein
MIVFKEGKTANKEAYIPLGDYKDRTIDLKTFLRG